MNDDDISFTPSFSRLAAICDCDRGTLRAIRDRDERFPKQGAQGWCVPATKLLLGIRRYERMTDTDYADFCAEYEMPKPGPDGRQEAIGFLLGCMKIWATMTDAKTQRRTIRQKEEKQK